MDHHIFRLIMTFISLCCANFTTSIPMPTNNVEKPLFVPSASYSNLYQSHPLRYGSGGLDMPSHTQYRNHYEYADILQRQPIYPSFEKRLEDILQTNHHHSTASNSETDEDEYKRKANNILYFEQAKPELEDLDRRYKRTLPYVPKNLDETQAQEISIPFGPFKTFLPFDDPSPLMSNETLRMFSNTLKNHTGRQRRQEELNTNSILPSDNYKNVFLREIPVQFSTIHEPANPKNRKPLENLSRLGNSLLVNTASTDFNDQMNFK